MSWHFSLELVADYLRATSSVGKRSVLLSADNIPETLCSNGKLTTCFINFLCGTTCGRSTDYPGEAKSESSAADSPAKESRLQAEAMGLRMKDPLSGLKCVESLGRYDPSTHSLKTHQLSLFEGSSKSSVTLPRWGCLVGGECWELSIPEEIAGASEFGLLPTPIATDWKGGTSAVRKDRGDVRTDQWRDYVKLAYGMTYPHPTHSELRMGWPEGWTDSKPLEMDKYRRWRASHSTSSEEV